MSEFLEELGTISGDMKQLQNESVEINQQLHNRQRVSCELSQFVADIIVPSNMIRYSFFEIHKYYAFIEQLRKKM